MSRCPAEYSSILCESPYQLGCADDAEVLLQLGNFKLHRLGNVVVAVKFLPHPVKEQIAEMGETPAEDKQIDIQQLVNIKRHTAR